MQETGPTNPRGTAAVPDLNHPSHDPREPLFPSCRDYRRHPVLAPLSALLLWHVLPWAAVLALGWATVLHPASPAPLGFLAALAWATRGFLAD